MLRLFLCLCLIWTCGQPAGQGVVPENMQNDKAEKAKQEIVAAGKAFAEMAQTHSLREAFLAFAAADAAMLRGKNLIRGREEIEKYFDQQTLKDARLEWAPDFVDAAASGDLGYTFGKYTLSGEDAAA